MRFSEWLKTYRKAAGLSQEMLADKISELGKPLNFSITAQQISNYEREYDKDADGNPTRPKELFLELAAQVLNVPINEARTVAGYATKKQTTESHEILQGVTVSFEHSVKLTRKDREKIIDAIRLIAVGVKAEQEGSEKGYLDSDVIEIKNVPLYSRPQIKTAEEYENDYLMSAVETDEDRKSVV